MTKSKDSPAPGGDNSLSDDDLESVSGGIQQQIQHENQKIQGVKTGAEDLDPLKR